MLRFGLILLVATCALAAPGYSSYEPVELNVVGRDKVGITKNTGRANHLVDILSSLFDGGDTTVNVITWNTITGDLGGVQDRAAQSLALSQSIAASLTQATGTPGDVCISTAMINAFASGNYKQALANFVDHISRNLSLLVTLKNNPEAARFASGPKSGCSAGGRVYDIEYAWNAILENASPATSGLLNEQYCTAKRLYSGLSLESNNVASVVTAISLPPVAKVFAEAYPALSNFVLALQGNGNVNQALNRAERALAAACR